MSLFLPAQPFPSPSSKAFKNRKQMRYRLRMNLKGISPLVAVVMLIAFTLVVAGILGSLATQFATDQRQKIQYCTGARILILNGVYRNAAGGLEDVTLNVHNFGDVDLTVDVLETQKNGTATKRVDGVLIKGGEIGQVTVPDLDVQKSDQFTIQSKECPGAQDLLRAENLRDVTGL